MKDIVVRIVKPLENPQPTKRFVEVAPPAEEEKNIFQKILHGIGLAAIAGLCLYFTVSFFSLGFALKEILIIVGIPLALGLITSYAINP